jgi:predicted MFS family arabinose efflux permease
MTDQISARPAGAARRRAHHVSDFNRLWLGQGISQLGSQVTALALPLTAVLYLKATPAQVGLLAAVRQLAFAGLMLFFGVVVDRRRRRTVMIISDLGRAAVTLAVPLLAWTATLTMPCLYAAAFLLGGLAAVFILAYRAYLPTLVGPGALLTANSRLQSTDSVADVAGPGLAGLLIQLMGAPFALIADGASFVVSAISVLAIRAPEPDVTPRPPSEHGIFRTLYSDIGAGLAFAFRHPVLRLIAAASGTFNFFATIMLTIFVLYAARTAHLSPGQIGLVFAAFGAGGVIAATTLSRTMKAGLGRLLAAGYVTGAAVIAALPFIGGTPVTRTAGLAALFLIAGYAIVSANVVEMTIRQAATPNDLQGRVAAGFYFLTAALTPLAALAAGALGSQIGPHATLLVAAAGVPASLPWIMLPRIRRLHNLDSLTVSATSSTLVRSIEAGRS